MLSTDTTAAQPQPRPREGFGAIRASDLRRLAALDLPTSTRMVWVALMAIVPPWGRRVSRAEIAELAGVHHRTARRSLDRLEEAGLIVIDRTGGGAHASMNMVRLIEKEPDTAQADEPAPVPVDAPPAVFRGPEISTPAVMTPSIDDALRDLFPGDVDALDDETRRHLARHYGLENAPANGASAPEAPPAPAAAQSEAERMVHDFHAYVRKDTAHQPLVREVRRAQGLLAVHGRAAWSIVQRACDALVKAGLADRAGTFLYLGPWVTKAGGRWL